jgi:hypothetical protein
MSKQLTEKDKSDLAKAFGKANQGHIFVKCCHCNKLVQVKYHRVRRWKMVCPECNEVVVDVKYNY